MQFEWDENKREDVIRKRDLDILHAALIFSGPVFTKIDDRNDYGEERFISLGMVDDECFIVVHVERNEKTRIITAWRGGRDEYERYQTGIAGRLGKNE